MKRSNGKIYVAITGGIGSGKSAAAKAVAELGFPVLSADEAGRAVYAEEDVKKRICAAFPDCAEGDKIDRKKLAEIVFHDASRKKQLEEVTHPAIMRRLFAEADAVKGGAVFFEIPLLFESGMQDLFDHIIVIMRDRVHRIRAVCARDGLSEGEVIARMQNQWDYEKNLPGGHTVLYNDGDLPSLYGKVRKVVHDILSDR